MQQQRSMKIEPLFHWHIPWEPTKTSVTAIQLLVVLLDGIFYFFFLIQKAKIYCYKSLYSFLVNMGTSTEKLENFYCVVWLQYSVYNIALSNLIPQKLSKYEYTHVNSCQSDSVFFSRLRLSGCHWLPVFLAFKSSLYCYVTTFCCG